MDFGARGLDSRIARWISPDPLHGRYPGLSPYSFVANSPIVFTDPDGRRIVIYYNGQDYEFKLTGHLPSIGDLSKAEEAIRYSMHTAIGKEVWEGIAGDNRVLKIEMLNVPENILGNKEVPMGKFIPSDNEHMEAQIGTVYWDYNHALTVVSHWSAFVTRILKHSVATLLPSPLSKASEN